VVEKAKTEELQDIKNKYVKAEPFFKKEAKPKISKKNNKNPATKIGEYRCMIYRRRLLVL